MMIIEKLIDTRRKGKRKYITAIKETRNTTTKKIKDIRNHQDGTEGTEIITTSITTIIIERKIRNRITKRDVGKATRRRKNRRNMNL